MDEELSKYGLFFDYLYNLRVLNPDVFDETSDLKQKSGDYIESKLVCRLVFDHFFRQFFYLFEGLKEFRQLIDDFIKISSSVVNEVEQEKMHAISAQNKLKSMSKQREAALQDLQVTISNQLASRKRKIDTIKRRSLCRIKLRRNHWNLNS